MNICSLQRSLGCVSNNFTSCASSLSGRIKNIAIRIFYQAMDAIYTFGYHALGTHFNIGTHKLLSRIRANHESYNDVPNVIKNNFIFSVDAVNENGLTLQYIPKDQWERRVGSCSSRTLLEEAIHSTPAALQYVSKEDSNRVYYGRVAARHHGSEALEYYPFSSFASDFKDDLEVVKDALKRNSFDHLSRVPLRVMCEYLKINWKAIFHLPIETVTKKEVIGIATGAFENDRSSRPDKFKGIRIPEHNRTEAFAIAMIPFIVYKEYSHFGIHTIYGLEQIGLDSRELKTTLAIYLEDNLTLDQIYRNYKSYVDDISTSDIGRVLGNRQCDKILDIIKQCKKYGKDKYVGQFTALLLTGVKKENVINFCRDDGLSLEYFPQYQNDADVVAAAKGSNPLAIKFASIRIRLSNLINQINQRQLPRSYLNRHSLSISTIKRVIESGF